MSSTHIYLESLFGSGAVQKYSKYICPKCSELLKDAVQTNCGHFVCEDCAGEIFFCYKEQARCPLKDCNQLLLGKDGTRYFPDRRLRREMDTELPKVQCFVKGCDWEGSYKEYSNHQREHPSTGLWKAKETENETPQLLRNVARQLLQHADSMEQTSNTSGRMGADSLRKDQIFKQAASNRSLKRAEDFQMFQDRSHTLDASDGLRFETTPESELPLAVAQTPKKGEHQLVPGATKPKALQSFDMVHNSVSQQANPILLPSLPSSVMEQGLTSASASAPKRASPGRCQRRRFPPHTQGTMTACLSPPMNSLWLHQANLPASSVLPQSPNSNISRSERTSTLLQECPQCKESKEKLKVLTNIVGHIIKGCTCRLKEKQTLGRNRFMSL